MKDLLKKIAKLDSAALVTQRVLFEKVATNFPWESDIFLSKEVTDVATEFLKLMDVAVLKMGRDYSADDLVPFLIALINDQENDHEIFNDQFLENLQNLALLVDTYRQIKPNGRIGKMRADEFNYLTFNLSLFLPAKVAETNLDQFATELAIHQKLNENSLTLVPAMKESTDALNVALDDWAKKIQRIEENILWVQKVYSGLKSNQNIDDFNSIRSQHIRDLFKEHNISVPFGNVRFLNIEDAKDYYNQLITHLEAENEEELLSKAKSVFLPLQNSENLDDFNSPEFLAIFKNQTAVKLPAYKAQFTNLKAIRSCLNQLKANLLDQKININMESSEAFYTAHNNLPGNVSLPTISNALNLRSSLTEIETKANAFFDVTQTLPADNRVGLQSHPYSYFLNDYSPYFMESLINLLRNTNSEEIDQDTVENFYHDRSQEFEQIEHVRNLSNACDDCIEHLKAILVTEAAKEDLLEPFRQLTDPVSLSKAPSTDNLAQTDAINSAPVPVIQKPAQTEQELRFSYDLDSFHKTLKTNMADNKVPTSEANILYAKASNSFKVQVESYQAALKLKKQLTQKGSPKTKLDNFTSVYHNKSVQRALTSNPDPFIVRFMANVGAILAKIFTLGFFGSTLKTTGQQLDSKIKKEIGVIPKRRSSFSL